MRGALITAFAAFAAFLATLVFAPPQPASALPATAAINYSHANADLVEVKRWYNRRYHRPYRYARRPYYRPYYRPYRYRPYYGYYRPYYWRRPGVGIWFGW